MAIIVPYFIKQLFHLFFFYIKLDSLSDSEFSESTVVRENCDIPIKVAQRPHQLINIIFLFPQEPLKRATTNEIKKKGEVLK